MRNDYLHPRSARASASVRLGVPPAVAASPILPLAARLSSTLRLDSNELIEVKPEWSSPKSDAPHKLHTPPRTAAHHASAPAQNEPTAPSPHRVSASRLASSASRRFAFPPRRTKIAERTRPNPRVILSHPPKPAKTCHPCRSIQNRQNKATCHFGSRFQSLAFPPCKTNPPIPIHASKNRDFVGQQAKQTHQTQTHSALSPTVRCQPCEI